MAQPGANNSFWRGPLMPIVVGVIGIALGLGIGQLFQPDSIITNPWIIMMGHKTGIGNKLRFKSLIPKSERGTLGKDEESFTDCSLIKDGTVTVEYLFNIELDCDQTNKVGDVEATFRLFKENDLLTPASISIEKNGVVVSTSNTLDVTSIDYNPISGQTDKCFVDFKFLAEFNVASIDRDSLYSIVFEITDTHPGENNVIAGLADIDCSVIEGIKENKLQYYRCIEAGNTHRKDHITIADIIFCDEE